MKLNKNSFGQGTIEYLVILAVVVVIGLIAVTVSNEFFDEATLQSQDGKQLLGSVSSNIVVKEAVVDNEGTALLSLENNTSEELTLTKISLDGVETPYDKILDTSGKAVIEVPSLSCICASGETSRTCVYEIYTMSKYGLESKQKTTVSLDCVSDAISEDEITEPTYPIDGECGSASGLISFTQPITNLCESGNATSVSFNEVDLNWEWSCTGINEGDDSLTCNTKREMGDGTEINPYTIINCQELQDMNQDLDASYILVEDIDCSETENWNGGLGFEPVGGPPYLFGTPFTGNFDGNNYTVSSLYINRDTDYCGLFGYAQSNISNVSLINVNITCGGYSGSLGGTAYGTITNIFVTGNVTGTDIVGGIIGNATGSFEKSQLTFIGNVIGTGRTGGLIGIGHGTLFNLKSTGSVTGGNSTGGLLSTNEGNLTKGYSTMNVQGNNSVGGLIGFAAVNSITSQSYAKGSVQGNTYVGGIIGTLQAGGINETYSAGQVVGNSNVGGLLGVAYPGYSMYENFWDIETSLQTNSAGNATGKTTAQITYNYNEEDTFSAWDFDDVWADDTDSTINDGYPYLQWQVE